MFRYFSILVFCTVCGFLAGYLLPGCTDSRVSITSGGFGGLGGSGGTGGESGSGGQST